MRTDRRRDASKSLASIGQSVGSRFDARGSDGCDIRIARALNAMMQRKGRVFCSATLLVELRATLPGRAQTWLVRSGWRRVRGVPAAPPGGYGGRDHPLVQENE